MKKINLSVMAVLLGTALAFAGSKGISFPKEQNLQWFILAPGGDPAEPDHYQLTNAVPSGCTVREERCAIYTEEDMANPGKPTLDGVESPSREVFRPFTK